MQRFEKEDGRATVTVTDSRPFTLQQKLARSCQENGLCPMSFVKKEPRFRGVIVAYGPMLKLTASLITNSLQDINQFLMGPGQYLL